MSQCPLCKVDMYMVTQWTFNSPKKHFMRCPKCGYEKDLKS